MALELEISPKTDGETFKVKTKNRRDGLPQVMIDAGNYGITLTLNHEELNQFIILLEELRAR